MKQMTAVAGCTCLAGVLALVAPIHGDADKRANVSTDEVMIVPIERTLDPSDLMLGPGGVPDIKVSRIGQDPGSDYSEYGVSGGIAAFSIATTSCNIGGVEADWFDGANAQGGDNRHPVIAQQMYRLSADNRRIEQIGMSWLKHSFCALSEQDPSGCGNCTAGFDCSVLSVGCADTYTSSRNGSTNLGPRRDVNPLGTTASGGTHQHPYPGPSGPGTIAGRLQVKTPMLSNPGARYFVEAQYVTHDEPVQNRHNNASWIEVNPPAGPNYTSDMTRAADIRQEEVALHAWQEADPQVAIVAADDSEGGRYFIAYRVYDNGDGTWDYEYAVRNMNSRLAAYQFEIPLLGDSGVTGIGFNDVDYHGGDGFNGQTFSATDWATAVLPDKITWTTDTEAADINANALRWGSQYNFRFTSTSAPIAGTATIGMYKDDSQSVQFSTLVPEQGGPLPIRVDLLSQVPSNIQAGVSTTFDVEVSPGDDTVIAGSEEMLYRFDGGTFLSAPMANVGGDLYQVSLPAADCDDVPEFYFIAEGQLTGVATDPVDAPTTVFDTVVGVDQNKLTDDFEADAGYTVSGDAVDGQWTRGVPVDCASRGAPGADADGSGNAWVTDNDDANSCNSDVDGGTTTLTSIAYAVADGDTVRWSYWFNDDEIAFLGPGDEMTVEYATNAGGTNWQSLRTYTTAAAVWREDSASVGSEIPVTSTLRLRWSVTDNSEGADVVEGGLDNFRIDEFVCDAAAPCPWDCSPPGGNGVINFDDVVAVVNGISTQDLACDVAPDNGNGTFGNGFINFDDLIAVINNFGSCP